MADQPADEGNGNEPAALPVASGPSQHDASESTVGTGSMLGLGCLVVVVLLVLLAIAYRMLGGTW